MIVFNLECGGHHRFEGWFASTEAFENQQARGLVTCPVCGSGTIERLPSAPYVLTRSAAHQPEAVAESTSRPPIPNEPTPEAAAVMALLRRMARESEDVGERFPEEARRIHHGDAEARNIRGQAKRDELEELHDEGILVLPVPPDDELH
ncbi:DUF1178 family protein [Pseudothauera nasutitermitis]|uniref:DUF1178 family protein n=1 Tax=Pseudothauera nasutitermitis TaxID=2565930 RepID=A0A4S4B405_9RHOO|nr:DUF1178 family protein [Pseudothauera nasutitermitis]THF67427.1 DUF1178 family protein [Pseudothauera nasutitermitis]